MRLPLVVQATEIFLRSTCKFLTEWFLVKKHVILEELRRERERNEGGVSKRETMVKTWNKRVVKVIVGI